MVKLPPLGRSWPLVPVEIPVAENPYPIGKYPWRGAQDPIPAEELAALSPPDFSVKDLQIYIAGCQECIAANRGNQNALNALHEHLAWAKSELLLKLSGCN